MCKDDWDDRLPVRVDLRDKEVEELVEALDALYQAYGGHALRVEDPSRAPLLVDAARLGNR
jgi:hypothetical protein